MDTITLEDYVEPVALNSIPQADFDSRTIRLSLPKLRNLTYIMRYTPKHCNMFLATLPSASLGVLTLCYPEFIPRSEEAHPSDHDLALLLSHPCLTKLESLTVENLRFEYLTLLYRAPVPRFQNINELALTITLDDETQRTVTFGFILTLCPNLTSLTIIILDARSILHVPQTRAVEVMDHANVAAQSAAVQQPEPIYLLQVSARLLDIFLLVLQLGVEHVQDLMAQHIAPSMEVADTPLQAMCIFLEDAQKYWNARPVNSDPRKVQLDIDVYHLEAMELLPPHALSLIDGSSVYALDIQIMCDPENVD